MAKRIDKIGLAVVGLGPWGRNLLRAFSTVDRARIVALCDIDPRRLSDPVLDAFEARRSTDPRELLGSEDVDAVVLATPPDAHASQCVAFLQHGKHVFVEKPMALRLKDALRIERVAARSQRKVMVGHILRYHTDFHRLTQVVSSGALGRVRTIRCDRLGAATALDEEPSWWALAPHDVSAMRALVGADPTGIGARLDVADATRPSIQALLQFPGGVTGTIRVSARAIRKTRRVTVTGDRGTAVFDDVLTHGKISIEPRALDPSEGSQEPYDCGSLVSDPEPLLLEARHFVSALADGAPIPTDAAEGRAVIAVLEAGVRSLRAGGAVTPIHSTQTAYVPSA